MLTLRELLDHVPQTGRLEWIGLCAARRAPVRSVERALLISDAGIVGDHHPSAGSRRQVTLIQFEHLAVIAALCEREHVSPELLRRNLAVSGINLLALKERRFYLGAVLLEGTGLCHPCSRMEEALGPGGYNAVRGHGGITARVLCDGEIQIGDKLSVAPASNAQIEFRLE